MQSIFRGMGVNAVKRMGRQTAVRCMPPEIPGSMSRWRTGLRDVEFESAAGRPSGNVDFERAAQPEAQREPAPAPAEEEGGRKGFGILAFTSVLSAFWSGSALAYISGYVGARGLALLDPRILSFVATITFLPPFLFIACGFAFSRAQSMAATARRLADATERLTAVDEGATAKAQRLGRAVRRELDALSVGLDGAFGRLRALETALEERVAQLEEAGARAGVRAENIAQRLSTERAGIEGLADRMDDAAQRGRRSARRSHRSAQSTDRGGRRRTQIRRHNPRDASDAISRSRRNAPRPRPSKRQLSSIEPRRTSRQWRTHRLRAPNSCSRVRRSSVPR